MAVRENLEVYGLADAASLLGTLKDQFGAKSHPMQPHAFLLEGVPFHTPHWVEDHLSILSFNNLPLPDALLEALLVHSELFPDEVRVRWTQEQDLILDATLGQLRGEARER